MPEGKFCNRRPINTEEDLKALLGDKGGQQYYKEMEMLEVDTVALWETLQKTCKSRTRTWLEICAHCGLCANSCFLYTANNRDPKQVPSYKIQSTLGEMLRRKGQVDTKFMIDTMEVAWAKCTCCNRCGTYCPHGIDMGVMFSYLRGVLYSQGFVPWELKIGAGMHRVYGAQMDVTTEDWVDTCEWMAEENAEEWPGLEIPIDKEDCDVMYILNAREPKHYPEDVAQAAILFHVAGEKWTVPSVGWENTSLSLFAGDWEACANNVKRIYGAVDRLRLKMPVTLQDSCNYIRNHGLAEHTRYIMSQIAEDFREMKCNREDNFCCGGGGGFNGIGKFRPQRDKGLYMKLQQIRETGAKMVISPCHNCWDAIRDMMEVYHVHDIKWSFLKPIIIDMMIVPDHLKPQDDE